MSEAQPAVLELRNLVRSFPQANGVLEIFKGANATLRRGEIVTLVGPSGAGKSSLLHIAGLLEPPTSGEILIEGKSVAGMSDRERTRIRRTTLGFVYQFHHLLPEFSALENIMMPQRLAGASAANARIEAMRLLDLVGLSQRATHRPAQLSGGEQQRVAIARALANKPKLLLADEPTGNLDPKTADRVFEVLLGIVRSEGLAALIATHNHKLIGYTDRTLLLHEGRLVDAGKLPLG
ncbi:MAG: ABC transporter ATP-binding protein [Alphaproteobacteria bacterium]|nr:ABC transporter ATP-binding protein [Alphaproteobacteria bacterium]